MTFDGAASEVRAYISATNAAGKGAHGSTDASSNQGAGWTEHGSYCSSGEDTCLKAYIPKGGASS